MIVAPEPVEGQPPGSWRQDAFVAASTFSAGLLGYGFNLVMSHALGAPAFGELSALLAVSIVATVPGTAMQAGIARRIARAPQRHEDAALLGQAVAVAGAVGAALVLLAPLLRSGLGVESWADVLWLAASTVPTTLAYGCLGVLQGRRRFVALGWLLALVQAARLAGGAIAAVTGSGVAGALAAGTTITACVVAVAAVRVVPWRHGSRAERLRGVLARDTLAMLGILLLSNLDLILARHYLPGRQAGLYAAGNLVTKAAFWGPSFVSTVAYPRLSRPLERRGAMIRGASVLGMLGVITVGAVALGAGLVPVVLGGAYRAMEGVAWLFALQGTALAGVLLGVYAGLAVHDRRLAGWVWLAVIAEAGAVALHWHHSLGQVLGVALCGSGVLLLAATAQQHALLLRPDRPAGRPS